MTRLTLLKAVLAGWVGGFAGNALLGILFSSPWAHRILFDPASQSPVFISLATQRNIAVSVAGLVALSAIHGLLYVQLQPSIPGRTRLAKGLAWGAVIWAMYWLFQEWFVYVTLLREPALLAAFELLVLLGGSLLEGVVIALMCPPPRRN